MREKYCWIIDKFRPQVNVLVWRNKLGCSTLQVATKASMACGVLPFLVSCVSRRRRRDGDVPACPPGNSFQRHSTTRRLAARMRSGWALLGRQKSSKIAIPIVPFSPLSNCGPLFILYMFHFCQASSRWSLFFF